MHTGLSKLFVCAVYFYTSLQYYVSFPNSSGIRCGFGSLCIICVACGDAAQVECIELVSCVISSQLERTKLMCVHLEMVLISAVSWNEPCEQKAMTCVFVCVHGVAYGLRRVEFCSHTRCEMGCLINC